ncbi:MAG TPA: hypothetical protein DCF68_00845 [Cyanothece sp. UBA12306]|nr:hypothetical protein [Cyanothece sp. UBA12306]
MKHFDDSSLNHLIPQEIETMMHKFKQLQTKKDVANQELLYQLLIEINRTLPSLPEEVDYHSFDR